MRTRRTADPHEGEGMSFRVRLWCRDCTGSDDRGCFDGGTEIVSEPSNWQTVKRFTTLREAVDAGYEETRDCGPWEFDVLADDDEEIDYEKMTETEIDAYVAKEKG